MNMVCNVTPPHLALRVLTVVTALLMNIFIHILKSTNCIGITTVSNNTDTVCGTRIEVRHKIWSSQLYLYGSFHSAHCYKAILHEYYSNNVLYYIKSLLSSFMERFIKKLCKLGSPLAMQRGHCTDAS